MRTRLLSCLLAAAASMFPLASRAADWWVSPSGDDATGSGTQAKPWRTIGHAIDLAAPGDHVRLMDDGADSADYEEVVEIPASLPGLVIEADVGAQPQVEPVAVGGAVFNVLADRAEIRALEIRGPKTGVGVQIGDGTSGVIVADCQIRDVDLGVAGTFLAGAGVVDCDFSGCDVAVQIEQSQRIDVTGNTSLEGAPIVVFQVDASRVGSNTVEGSASAGLLMKGSFNLVDNNSLAFNKIGISYEAGAHAALIYNTVSDSTGDGMELGNSPTKLSASLLLQNVAVGNGGSGIDMTCYGCILLQNTVAGNGGPGLAFLSGGNHLFLNDVTDNGQGVCQGSDPGSTWGPPIPFPWQYQGAVFHGQPGNHYGSGYAGTDDGSGGGLAGDGVGDTLLPVPTDGAGDANPLVESQSVIHPRIWILGKAALLAPTMGEQCTDCIDAPLLDLAPGQTLTLATVDAAQDLLLFRPGAMEDATAWNVHLLLSQAAAQPGGYLVRVGWLDPEGEFRFGPDGPAHAFAPAFGQTMLQSALDPAWLVIPEGGRLALSLTSNFAVGDTVLQPWVSLLSASWPETPPYPYSSLQPPESLGVLPEGLVFGSLSKGQSETKTVVVKNSGTSPVTIDKVLAAGEAAESLELAESGCLEAGTPKLLAPGDSCALDVSFFGGKVGPRFAAVLILSDDPGAPVLPIPVTADVGPHHKLTVSIDPPEAAVLLGDGISCPSDCAQNLDPGTAAALHATFKKGFGLLSWEGCDAVDGATCTVTVDAPATVVLHAKLLAPIAFVDPPGLDFGTAAEGEAKGPLSVEVRNDGDAPLEVGALAVTGAEAASFLLSGDACSKVAVAPGAACTADITFKPTKGGDLSAALEIPTNDPSGAVLVVPLSGVSEAAERMLSVVIVPPGGGTVTGEGIACPGDCVESWFEPKSVTLTAAAAAGYALVQMTGCPKGQTECQVQVDGAKTVVAMFRLKAPSVLVAPAGIELGAALIGTEAGPAVCTIQNLGDAPLVVGAAVMEGILAGEFLLDTSGCAGASLEWGGACTLSVRLVPGGPGTRAATLRVESNDPLRPVLFVPVRGVGLEGPGDVVEQPDSGSDVYSGVVGLPIVAQPSTVNFGGVEVGSTSQPVDVYLTNVAAVALRLKVPHFEEMMMEGASLAEEGEFDVLFTDCDNALLAGGAACTVRLQFSPRSEGLISAEFVIDTDFPDQPSVKVTVYGTGGSPSGGGCSAAGPAAGPGGVALLLLPLLLLALFRRGLEAVARAVAGLLSLFRKSGGVVVLAAAGLLAAACVENAVDVCDGEMGLVVEEDPAVNALHEINDAVRWICGAQTYSCHEVYLACFEDASHEAYEQGQYVVFSVSLQPPMFVGRVYGPGTTMLYQRRGALFPLEHVVVSGGIKVEDVELHEQDLACVHNITLEFDADFGSMEGELANWGSPPPVISHVKGSVQYSFGGPGWDTSMSERTDTVVWTDCSAPHVETGAEDSHLGYSYLPYGLELETDMLGKAGDCPAGSGACCGTDVNRVTVHDERTVVQDPGGPQVQESAVAVIEPPDVLVGNWICDLSELTSPHEACPVWHMPSGPVTLDLPGVPMGRYGPVTDAFDPSWKDNVGTLPDTVVTRPMPGEQLFQGLPLHVEWETQEPAGEGVVEILVAGPAGRQGADPPVPLEVVLEVPDTGSTVLDPAFFTGYAGAASVRVERRFDVPFVGKCPFREGSVIHATRAGAVAFTLEAQVGIPFPDPLQANEGWLPGEEVFARSTGAAFEYAPDIAVDQEGAAWVAGVVAADSGSGNRAALFSGQGGGGQWQEFGADALTAMDANVSVMTRGEWVLVTGCLLSAAEEGLCQPAAVVISPSGEAQGGPIEGLPGMLPGVPWGATLLADGTLLLAWADEVSGLQMKRGALPWEPVPGAMPAGKAPGAFAFALANGLVAMGHLTAGTFGDVPALWLGDPDGGAAASAAAVADTFPASAEFMSPVSDGFEALHYLYKAAVGDQGTVSMHEALYLLADSLGGAFAGGPVSGPYFEPVQAQAMPEALAMGQDGVGWALFGYPCKAGSCALLMRHLGAGEWEGPLVPGHAFGDMDLAVGPDGRVHLVWSPETGGSAGLPVYYSAMEVAP